ncbi:hypothetical protein M758_9G024000 [Ceratodon purpureus]|nr:hypothetical protein M758_9G024000 [Ceratodon purpureus]
MQIFVSAPINPVTYIQHIKPASLSSIARFQLRRNPLLSTSPSIPSPSKLTQELPLICLECNMNSFPTNTIIKNLDTLLLQGGQSPSSLTHQTSSPTFRQQPTTHHQHLDSQSGSSNTESSF